MGEDRSNSAISKNTRKGGLRIKISGKTNPNNTYSNKRSLTTSSTTTPVGNNFNSQLMEMVNKNSEDQANSTKADEMKMESVLIHKDNSRKDVDRDQNGPSKK